MSIASRCRLPILDRALKSLGALARVGERYGGFIPSMLDLGGQDMLRTWPRDLEPADIHRGGDRAYDGCNLLHDFPTLALMRAAAQLPGQEDLGRAAEHYLDAFMERCARATKGLFAWGEHAYWNLAEGRVDNSWVHIGSNSPLTHDHLRPAPPWLWEALFSRDPERVRQFGRALAGHWQPERPQEYFRHCVIATGQPNELRQDGSRDFPRHAGFYILDLACILALGGADDELRRLLLRFSNHWWDRRNPDTGLCNGESRQTAPGQYESPHQTLCLGVNQLEAARVLAPHDPALAAMLHERGAALVSAYVKIDHGADQGRLLTMHYLHNDERVFTTGWGSTYGGNTGMTGPALCLLRAHVLNHDADALALAAQVADWYAQHPLPRPDTVIPVRDAGGVFQLWTALAEVTAQQRWYDIALDNSEAYLERWMPGVLPAAANGAVWYESQLMPGYFLGGLLRVGLGPEQMALVPWEWSHQ